MSPDATVNAARRKVAAIRTANHTWTMRQFEHWSWLRTALVNGDGRLRRSRRLRAQALPGGFVYPPRHRSLHHPGHPLRRREQFRRPAACGLRRRRMRGEARGRTGAESASSRNWRQQKLSLKMLDCYRPARAVARHGGVGAERPGDAGRAALQSRLQQSGPVPARLHRRAFRPFHRRRGRSHAGRSEGRQFGRCSIPTRPMPTARRRSTPARRKAASTWAPAMIVPMSRRTPRRPSITPAQRRWRNLLVAAMAPARLCELFEGVVALFAAGRGRGGL